MTSAWTDVRLGRLFERYRLRYWPDSRRLRSYRMQVSPLDGHYGQCDLKARRIDIDPSPHRTDREVRATVLHEMVHAVVGRGGHHAPFWMQLEYLLSRDAPVSVGFPELGERGSHLSLIPVRFRRSRRLFRSVYERNRRAIERRVKNLPVHNITPPVLEQECFDAAALEGLRWRAIWRLKAHEYGFVDLDDQVLPWARPYVEAARRGYNRGRRFYLDDQRLRAEGFPCNFPCGPDTR